MSKKSWVDIFRENIEAATPDTDMVRSYLHELKLIKAMHNGTDAEIAEAEYHVHLDEGGMIQ